ncbi:MAG: ATP-dependent Clp protease adaptor ClpS [Alphaproteobacteria bacterium]|nr:ATP-dependent Clp protease adaptor ClpS [Alphaproteobacteria bacterium]
MPKTESDVKEEVIVEFPKKYHVILHNDDVTPMGFVVEILIEIFGMEAKNAIALMLEIHTKGKGIAGTYIKSIAESKVTLVRDVALKAEYPLTATIEVAE